MNDWDAVSSDTPPNGITDAWDAVSTPQRFTPPIKEPFLEANTSPEYQQERQIDETRAKAPAGIPGVSPDLAAAMKRRRRRQQGQPEQEAEPEIITAAPEQVLQTRKLSDADIPVISSFEDEQPEEEVIEASRKSWKTREARLPVKRGAIKGSSIAIIVLCIAVIGLSTFSALNIFHVVNFNIGNAIAPANRNNQTASVLVQDTSGTPAISDSLSDDRNNWDIFTTIWGGQCAFTGGAYHIALSKQGYFIWCTSGIINNFNNFALQVEITINQGDVSSIIFGGGKYSIDIHANGEYGVYQLNGNQPVTNLKYGSSPALKQGLNQLNIITIIVNNGSFYLYANQQLLTSYFLNNYVAGNLDLAAVSFNQAPVDIAYSNLKIWTL